ncbi:hypothetical protein ACPOL_1345 [Acidisarcina polymorpha]|uniref:Uncharacterized protein n=1 Tax=Acidisarcina polymorpha TaxID=2211140 RepID=A0A2Z5FUX7_9BACT|nr:hypothetical protein ACPOL_1345 [Acidisarcina polymorpha]
MNSIRPLRIELFCGIRLAEIVSAAPSSSGWVDEVIGSPDLCA